MESDPFFAGSSIPTEDNPSSSSLSSSSVSSSSSSSLSSSSSSSSPSTTSSTIRNNDTVPTVPSTDTTTPPPITLHIKTLDESNFSLQLSTLDITIYDLKCLIQQRTSLSIERIRLIFRGRVCQNTESLRQCKIESNMTIHLVARCADMSISSPDYSSLRSPSDTLATNTNGTISPEPPVARSSSSSSSFSASIESTSNTNPSAVRNLGQTFTDHTAEPSVTVISNLNRSTSLPVSSSSSSSSSTVTSTAPSSSPVSSSSSSSSSVSSLLPTLPTRNYEHIYQILHTLRTTLIATGWEITDNQIGTVQGPVQEPFPSPPILSNSTTVSLSSSGSSVTNPSLSTSSSSNTLTASSSIFSASSSASLPTPNSSVPSSSSTLPSHPTPTVPAANPSVVAPFQSSAALAAQGSLLLPSSSTPSPNNLPTAPEAVLSPSTLPLRSTLNVASRTRRYFVVGQWVDVLDTIEQWLEATIVRTDREFVLIHYNGWPQRWDEWLHVDSPRIAPFRTRSQHTTQPIAHCPLPVNILPHAPRVGPPPPLLNLPSMENLHAEAVHSLDADDIAVTVRLRPDDVRPALSRTSEAVYIMEKLLRTLAELTSEQPRREARRSALHSGAKASSVYHNTNIVRTESKEDENESGSSKWSESSFVNPSEAKHASTTTISPVSSGKSGLLYAQPKPSSSSSVSPVSPYRTYDSPQHRRTGNPPPSSPLANVSTRTLSFSPALTASPGLADLDIASPVPLPSPVQTNTDGTKESKQDSLALSTTNPLNDETTTLPTTVDSTTDQETIARAARVRDYQQGVEDRYEIEAVASQLAPMMDKIGRILIDLSPHIEALSRSPTFISAETTVHSTITSASNVVVSPSSTDTANANVTGMDNEIESVQNALSRLRGQVSRVRADTYRLSSDVNRLLGEVRNVTVPSSIGSTNNTTISNEDTETTDTVTTGTPSSSLPNVTTVPTNGEPSVSSSSSTGRSSTIWRLNTNALPLSLSNVSSIGTTPRYTNPSAWLASRYNINRNNSVPFGNMVSQAGSNVPNPSHDPTTNSFRTLARRYVMTPAVRDAVVAGFTGLIRSPVNIITNEMNVLSVRQPGWGLATGDGSLSLIRDTEAGRRALAHSSLMQSLAFTALTSVLRSNTEPATRENTSTNPNSRGAP